MVKIKEPLLLTTPSLACLRSDIAAEPVVSPWDIAALQILVEEAGGVCTDLLGGSPQRGTGALSANPELHRLAVEALAAPAGTTTGAATIP